MWHYTGLQNNFWFVFNHSISSKRFVSILVPVHARSSLQVTLGFIFPTFTAPILPSEGEGGPGLGQTLLTQHLRGCSGSL